ncbi:hypothetical protein [Leptospira noguchii]|uniref:hypothetical protein n=1 Tax=Leptospira noguchii TaxID=28182 RepID=UPI001C66DFD4|nr:hypothetical protein [Leptospira noguchii]
MSYPTQNVGNSTQRSLRIALWGGNSVLQRICRNSHRFNIEIQILVGKVMAHYGSRWKLNTTLSYGSAFRESLH